MSEEATYVVKVDERLAAWAAASWKASTVERFLAEAIAFAILDELDGGEVSVEVGECRVSISMPSGSDA